MTLLCSTTLVAQMPREKDRPLDGKLAIGDVAPDFKLRSLVGKDEVRLANSRDKRPVVLVFGSYT